MLNFPLDGGDKHVEYIIPKGQHSLNLYIEVACNGMFGNGNGGDINPPNPDRTFNLVRAELIQHNSEAYALIYDLQILRDTASQLGEEHPVGCQALAVANEIVNVFEKGDKSSILKARKLAWDKFFGKGGASQAHKIIAVGHCHIGILRFSIEVIILIGKILLGSGHTTKQDGKPPDLGLDNCS